MREIEEHRGLCGIIFLAKIGLFHNSKLNTMYNFMTLHQEKYIIINPLSFPLHLSI